VLFITGKTTPPNVFPFTPGWEGAGTIVEVGSAITAEGLLGKRVGFSRQKEQGYFTGGSYAEFAVTDVMSIIPLRDETKFEEGVALFVNPLSALCMVHRCKQLQAKAVVITAAAS
jgi:NADPH:quinone reductase-like Zn-dependent oxidoreductase